MVENKPLIYVAGPYSDGDPIENTRRAVRAADELLDTGMFHVVVPHTSLIYHAISPKIHAVWVELGCALARRCDAVLRLSGVSPGADAEVREASALGKPIFTDAQDAIRWFVEVANGQGGEVG